MKKSIYKITNKINGKSYIGQTNNIKRRFMEHKNMKSIKDEEETKILYQAFKKYGILNFTFEVLEEEIENYNEREIYWINFYHTYIQDPQCQGYNMTPGGENPPVFQGENHPMAMHSQSEINLIINLIKNTKLSFKQIAEQSNYNISSIERINKGELWFNNSLNYPLRSENTKEFLQKRADNIIYDLQNTNLTQKEIAEKYKVGRTTITAINNGQNYHKENIVYPIRNASIKTQDKPVIMYNIETLQPIREFKNSIEAAKFLNKTKIKSGASNIRHAALDFKNRTAYGYKWSFKNK